MLCDVRWIVGASEPLPLMATFPGLLQQHDSRLRFAWKQLSSWCCHASRTQQIRTVHLQKVVTAKGKPQHSWMWPVPRFCSRLDLRGSLLKTVWRMSFRKLNQHEPNQFPKQVEYVCIYIYIYIYIYVYIDCSCVCVAHMKMARPGRTHFFKYIEHMRN